MQSKLITPSSPLLHAAALTALAVASTAQGSWTYEGDGFHHPTATGLSADHVAVIDFDGDGLPDLLAHEDDNSMTVNLELAATSATYRLPDVAAFAVTRTGGERVWAVTGRNVVEMTFADLEAQTSGTPTGISTTGFVDLIAQDRPGGMRLVLIDQWGARVRVFGPDGSAAWTQLAEHWASVQDGPFLDAALVDWDNRGFDWLATLDGAGLDLLDPHGGLAVTYPGDPTAAFLDVVPASVAPRGRDLLVYHGRGDSSAPFLVWLLNGEHGEAHPTAGMNVRQVLVGDFVGGTEPELCIASGTSRDLWIQKGKRAPAATESYFYFDYGDTFHADLDVGVSTINAAPAGAMADVDGDGDLDLVFVDDEGEKVVLTSTIADDDSMRVLIGEQYPGFSGGDLVYGAWVQCPPGSNECWFELWRHVEGGAPTLVESAMLPGAGTWNNLTVKSEPLLEEPIYTFVFRAVDAAGLVQYPARVSVWSPDTAKDHELWVSAEAAYPWKGAEGGAETGGTTRTPIIDPPPPLLP